MVLHSQSCISCGLGRAAAKPRCDILYPVRMLSTVYLQNFIGDMPNLLGLLRRWRRSSAFLVVGDIHSEELKAPVHLHFGSIDAEV